MQVALGGSAEREDSWVRDTGRALLTWAAEGLPTDAAVWRQLDLMAQEGSLRDGDVPVLLTRLIAKNHEVRLQYITGQWLDIDDALDLARARNLL